MADARSLSQVVSASLQLGKGCHSLVNHYPCDISCSHTAAATICVIRWNGLFSPDLYLCFIALCSNDISVTAPQFDSRRLLASLKAHDSLHIAADKSNRYRKTLAR